MDQIVKKAIDNLWPKTERDRTLVSIIILSLVLLPNLFNFLNHEVDRNVNAESSITNSVINTGDGNTFNIDMESDEYVPLDATFLPKLNQSLKGHEDKIISISAVINNESSSRHAKQIYDYLKSLNRKVGNGVNTLIPNYNDPMLSSSDTVKINRGAIDTVTITVYR